jgi:SAM-dependent methyltransferase
MEPVISGNVFDKYASKNFVVNYLMRNYFYALDTLLRKTTGRRVHEVGCGEGYLTLHLRQLGYDIFGTDISEEILKKAVEINDVAGGGEKIVFSTVSIYDLSPECHAADIVICCEVLEHLAYPEQGIDVLSKLARPWLIAGVPREPLWSALNMARGKYWSRLGNTPGHVQKWSSAGFIRFLETRFEIVATATPFPWTMCLCRTKNIEHQCT